MSRRGSRKEAGMKNGLYVKRMLFVCAMAGCFTGFGIDALLQKEDAKDNTLIREEHDSVFFSEEISVTPVPTVTESLTGAPPTLPTKVLLPAPTKVPAGDPTPIPADDLSQVIDIVVTIVPSNGPTTAPTVAPTGIPTPVPGKVITPVPTKAPTGEMTPVPTQQPTQKPEEVSGETDGDKQEVITYPAEIFGQVPEIDRTDGTVTYFEFAMDLIALVETEIQQKNLNEISLFTKFMMKALFCGISIEDLQINDPVPRRQAALGIHLAAEVLGKSGTIKSAKNVTLYATDVGNCSTAEKKAVIYLYEIGVAESRNGQFFFPDSDLTENEYGVWMKHLKAEWQ